MVSQYIYVCVEVRGGARGVLGRPVCMMTMRVMISLCEEYPMGT